MELEVSAEAKDKRLNRLVALTVVTFSVTVGLGHIKDGNLVQRMALIKAEQVDRWNEYQATRIKARVVQAARASGATAPELAQTLAKYQAETPQLQRQASELGERYESLEARHQQFDLAEAAITVALSIAAVAALIESSALLGVAWLFGGFGVVMTLAGFLQLPFRPEALVNLFG